MSDVAKSLRINTIEINTLNTRNVWTKGIENSLVIYVQGMYYFLYLESYHVCISLYFDFVVINECINIYYYH